LSAKPAFTCASILDRKVSRGHTFLVADGGLHHHLSASGNFGQVIRKNYPVAIGNRMDAPRAKPVSVVGPLCTPLDILATA
jgi:diaminopimelate decarboxylase